MGAAAKLVASVSFTSAGRPQPATATMAYVQLRVGGHGCVRDKTGHLEKSLKNLGDKIGHMEKNLGDTSDHTEKNLGDKIGHLSDKR